MKPFIFTLTAALGLATSLSAAEVTDTDGDGVFSMEEMQLAYPDLSGDAFLQIDADGDSMVSPDELAAALAAGLIAG